MLIIIVGLLSDEIFSSRGNPPDGGIPAVLFGCAAQHLRRSSPLADWRYQLSGELAPLKAGASGSISEGVLPVTGGYTLGGAAF